MLKQLVFGLTALTLGTSLLSAQYGRHSSTPPTPEQSVAGKVARLTALLTLTTAQQGQATTIFTTEQTALTVLATPRQTATTALKTAIENNDSTGIQTQATALGSLEQQRVLAEATADAAFYAILTPTQQTTYNNARLGGHVWPRGR